MNDETDLVVAEQMAAFERVEPPATWDRAVGMATGRGGVGRRIRAGWLVAAAVVVIVAVSVSIMVVGGERTGQQIETPPADRGESVDSKGPSLNEVPTSFEPPPIEPRMGAAVVWTGSELVIWGGHDIAACCGVSASAAEVSYSDGAALDPWTGEWRLLSDAPIGPSLGASLAASTDHGLIVARDRSVALLDSSGSPSGHWLPLPDAPNPVHDIAVIGSALVSASAGGVFDLASGTWHPLPAPPVELSSPQTVRMGDEAVIVGLAGDGDCGVFGSGCRMEAMSYDPALDSWRSLQSPPDGLAWHTFRIASDGDRLIVVSGRGQAAQFDLAVGDWSPVEHPPGEVSEWFESPVVMVGGTSMVAMADRLAVRSADGTWSAGVDESRRVPFGREGSTVRWVELVPAPEGSAFAVSLDPIDRVQEVARFDLVALADEHRDASVADAGRRTSGWLIALLDQGLQVAVLDLGSGEHLVFNAARGQDERFEGGAVRPNGDVVLWSQQAVYLYGDGGRAAARLLEPTVRDGGLRVAMTPDGSGIWIANRLSPLRAEENTTRVRLVDLDTAVVRAEASVPDRASSVLATDDGLVLGTFRIGAGPDGMSGVPGSERLYLLGVDGELREISAPSAGAPHLVSGRYLLALGTPPPNWFEVVDLHDGSSWFIARPEWHSSTSPGALSPAGEVVVVFGESPVDAFGRLPRVAAVSVADGSVREIWQSDGPGPIRAAWADSGRQIVVVQGGRVLVFDASEPMAGPTLIGELPEAAPSILAG